RADAFKFIRLQGKFPVEAINDAELNAIFLAWDVLCPGWAEAMWKECKRSTPLCDPGFGGFTQWREIALRPKDKPDAWARLEAVPEGPIGRLEELLALHEEIAGDDAPERADRASFDPSPSFERLRRFQSAKHRELLRTLDELSKMRKGLSTGTEKETKPVAQD